MTLINKSKYFIDSIRVRFRGGKGGDGCISMLHLFANEFAGPSGGNGGNGGHIVLRANSKIKSLNKLARYYGGFPGGPGSGKHLYGACAEHKFIDVPLGTLVCKPAFSHNLEDHPELKLEESDVIAELDQDGSMFIAARGGAGGRGNASYLSNKNRHPRVAQAGALGEQTYYELKMKIYSHFGLIGLPNAGKSTLVNSLTNANVKVADYAFSTKHPNVGVMFYDEDYTQVAISDLPGIIDESSNNRGLGLRFLSHIQKCVSFLYVIDLTSDPIRQIITLSTEIDQYRSNMSRRKHLIVGNKIDQLENIDVINEFEEYLSKQWPGSKFIAISAKRGDNLETLRQEIRRLYDEYISSCDDDDCLKW